MAEARVKEEGSPFSIVLDKTFDTKKVIITPKIITKVNDKAEIIDENSPALYPTKNMVITAINVGNRPLQGTKVFVMVAINRSLGESIMRQLTTPAALHPNPMHIVNACLPQVHAFLK